MWNSRYFESRMATRAASRDLVQTLAKILLRNSPAVFTQQRELKIILIGFPRPDTARCNCRALLPQTRTKFRMFAKFPTFARRARRANGTVSDSNGDLRLICVMSVCIFCSRAR